MPVQDIYILESYQLLPNGHHYYSLRESREDGETIECLTDNFFNRMEQLPAAEQELNRLVEIIDVLDKRRLSFLDADIIRFENRAAALPPSPSKLRWLGLDDDTILLRLYCYPVSEQVMILFNGGYKTPGHIAAQDCPHVGPHFKFAQRAVRALEQIPRDWEVKGNLIIPENHEIWL